MPELAELKLTSDFINHTCWGKTFVGVEKNPTHKGETINIEYSFNISAKSKGKELQLIFSTADDNLTTEEPGDHIQLAYLMMTMGMSGHFTWLNPGETHKHAHLRFKCETGGELAFVDVRRFGKWKFGFWNKDRGPDPTDQFQDFVRNIKNNLHKKDFDKPICEVLMNQRYFNGIGNYLRAEILYRVDTNPFLSARETLQKNPNIYQLCRWAPLQAYKLGGGQLKDWENPFGKNTDVSSWDEFMLCYSNPQMGRIVDNNGRTFWYDPKWHGFEYLLTKGRPETNSNTNI
jgi:endonuclease VIII-like 1